MTTKQLHAVMLLFTMLSAFLQMRALSDTIPYVNQYNPQGLHCFISPSNSWGIADQDGAIILDPVYMMIDDKYEYAGLFLFSNDGLMADRYSVRLSTRAARWSLSHSIMERTIRSFLMGGHGL